MAPERKDFMRETVRGLKKDNPGMSLSQIAKRIGLPGKQWVYYYLKPIRDTFKRKR